MDKEKSQPHAISSDFHDRRDFAIALLLVLVTAALRYANRGALYFVDGPRLAYVITQGTYVIQPPGYLAFAHLGGLFRDPAAGLSFWNISFSALGAGMFYLLCRLKGASRWICFVAALTFTSVYYVWFAGEIHSSYATQIFFPLLALYCFFRYRVNRNDGWTVAWAFSAAADMALRPSDGVLLLPLWIFCLARYAPQLKTWAVFIAINAAAFMAWYLPTRHALKVGHQFSTSSTLLISMQTVSPLLTGINERSLANVSRVIVPLLVALWALAPSVFSKRGREDNLIAAIWCVPGLCFFALCYMADPTYLVFLTAAFFWLVITSRNSRRALACLLVCFIFNTSLFFFARPLAAHAGVDRIVNFYAVKYTRYGIQHQWSSTIGDGAKLP